MTYDVSYYYEDGTYDLLIRRKYKSDFEALQSEIKRTLDNNQNPKKRNIDHLVMYRYVPQICDWKCIGKQYFNGNQIK